MIRGNIPNPLGVSENDELWSTFMKIVDFHVHVGKGAKKTLLPEELLKLMDRHHIEKSVLCPVEEYISVRNREGNDYLIRLVREYRDRFHGFAVANPWCGREACDELRRALDKGLRGFKINSILQGFMLSDEMTDPLLRICAEYKAPVYAHTGTMGNATPFQLLELARRHPKVHFVMGHTAFSDFWYDVIPVMEQTQNIFVETSHASPDTIEGVVNRFGVDRILFGSDLPESNLPLEIKRLKLLRLDARQEKTVFFSNAERLLEDINDH